LDDIDSYIHNLVREAKAIYTVNDPERPLIIVDRGCKGLVMIYPSYDPGHEDKGVAVSFDIAA